MGKTCSIWISVLLFLPTLVFAQQSDPVTASPKAAVPSPGNPIRPILPDVLVTDKAGKPVPELEPTDFTLLDNNQPRKILGFRRADGTVGNRIDPPVEAIVVLDAVNMP
jgi:hypothetical protein